jgi:hypothetical protein
VLYDPKAFITHAASLRQGFPHCAIFPTAASRRSLGRVSVPVWLIILSDQLAINALVSRYLTNKLMARRPIPQRQLASRGYLWPLPPKRAWSYPVLARVSSSCPSLRGRLPTCYSPVRRFTCLPKETFSLDLHVLGTPPAFVLSQDQTLQYLLMSPEGFIDNLELYQGSAFLILAYSVPRNPKVTRNSPLFSFQRPTCRCRQPAVYRKRQCPCQTLSQTKFERFEKAHNVRKSMSPRTGP